MQVELTKRVAEIYRELLPAPEVEAALNELMFANIEDMDLFYEFLEELVKHNGDMTRIVGRTHEPVSMDQFIEDDWFLGKVFTPYPGVQDMIKETCEGGYVQWLGTGAIGIGKTTAAQIIQARGLYEMSCERFPQARYGLMPTSSIVLAMMNRTEMLARDVTYGEFHNFLSKVPYFNDDFAFDQDVKRQMEFPNNIRVEYAAADALKLLGKNVMAGILDEMNFQARIEKSKRGNEKGFFDQAKEVFSQMVSRRKSRFEVQGRVPGILCVVSSANYAGDFTDTLKQKVKEENDGLTMVWDKPQWEVLPADRFGPNRWRLEIGNERFSSRILSDTDTAREGAEIKWVPMEYLKDAKDDFNTFMRNAAGIVTLADRTFFYDNERIWAMGDLFLQKGISQTFPTIETACLSRGLPLLEPRFQVPYPDRLRAIHVDLSVTGDATGFAMGFVEGVEAVARRGEKGKIVEEVPKVIYDCLLQITPLKGQEIEFADIRELIYMLDDAGYPIKWITFDGFQSVDNRQILRNMGYQTDTVSVEGKEAYEALRTAVWQHRIAAPEHHICFNELAFLKEDREKQKVDHLPNKSKDVSDAMCGVYYTLMKQRDSWRNPLPMVTIKDPGSGRTRSVVAPTTQPLTTRRDIRRKDISRR